MSDATMEMVFQKRNALWSVSGPLRGWEIEVGNGEQVMQALVDSLKG